MGKQQSRVENMVKWNDKNIFVTGAAGIVGSWLIKKLVENKANITCLIRDITPKSEFFISRLDKKTNLVQGELQNYNQMERIFNEFEIDTCIHLGAQAIVGTANRLPYSTFESNIRGTYTLLEAARKSELIKAIVVASSDKAYGSHDTLPYDETFSLNATNPYDMSKSCTDMIAQSYAKTYGMPIAISRCGNIYGGGDLNFNRIVPGTIKSIIFNQNPMIRSDGTYLRDYFYVKDAVNGYIILAENLPKFKGHAFNFGTEKPISVIDLVNKMISMFKTKRKIKPKILNKAKNEIKNQYLDCKKSRELLNWYPKFSLEKGLKETYQWYKKFFNEK